MKIQIYKNRKVYTEKNSFGTNNENKVEELEFVFPERLWKLYKNNRVWSRQQEICGCNWK